MPQTALAELYASAAPNARRPAYLLTGDTVLAEDMVQDCFVKLAGLLDGTDDTSVVTSMAAGVRCPAR